MSDPLLASAEQRQQRLLQKEDLIATFLLVLRNGSFNFLLLHEILLDAFLSFLIFPSEGLALFIDD